MKIVNIMKVADFEIQDILPEVQKFFTAFKWYEDAVLSEDLYSPADAMDSDHFHKLSPPAQEQIRAIVVLCSSQDCAYVRLIDDRAVCPVVRMANAQN